MVVVGEPGVVEAEWTARGRLKVPQWCEHCLPLVPAELLADSVAMAARKGARVVHGMMVWEPMKLLMLMHGHDDSVLFLHQVLQELHGFDVVVVEVAV